MFISTEANRANEGIGLRPNSKARAPEKLQTSIFKQAAVGSFEVWRLELTHLCFRLAWE
jgi:hypothetical protein